MLWAIVSNSVFATVPSERVSLTALRSFFTHLARSQDKINLAQAYGATLSRQSDQKFPRTKFGTPILNTNTTKKEEVHDYQGMLLGLLLAILSDEVEKSCLLKGQWTRYDY